MTDWNNILYGIAVAVTVSIVRDLSARKEIKSLKKHYESLIEEKDKIIQRLMRENGSK